MKKLAVLLALMLLCSSSFAQQLTKDEKRALELKPGVVLVFLVATGTITFNVCGQPFRFGHRASGTGFLYRPDGYIVTNGHVVEHANQKDPRAVAQWQQSLKDDLIESLKSGDAFAPIEECLHLQLNPRQKQEVINRGFSIKYDNPILKVVLANGKQYDADILQYSPPIPDGKDVAVIKIPATDLPTVALGDSSTVRVQDTVLVIGFPGVVSTGLGGELSRYISRESDLVPSATNGHISALRNAPNGSPVLQTDVAMTHGNSGGPAFDQNGNVIGIATLGSQRAAGFNFLVPINTAMEFVRQAGVAQASGSFNHVWDNALDLYDSGKCKDAVAQFDNALQLMPGLPDAGEYRNLASKCYENKNPMQRFMETSSWTVWAAGGIILAALVVFMMTRRSASAPAAARAGGGAGGTRLEAPPGSPSLPPAAPAASYGSIQATAGSLSGRTFKVTKEGLLLGRSPKCQVVLQDDTVSNEHAWIVPAGNEVVVIDKGSSNGTYVNSVDSPKVSKVGLRNGDRIYLGKKGTAVFTYFAS